jgi:hypothetical protein
MDLTRYENKLPDKGVTEIIKKIFRDNSGEFSGLELTIELENKNLNAKELSDLLQFIYRIDGKLYYRGFNSYSKTKHIQLEITEFKSGSVQLIIDSISKFIEPQTIILAWFALKYLPSILSSISGSLVNFTQSLKNFGDYQKATLEIRRGRKEIRDLIRNDSDLGDLDKSVQEKIVKVLEEIYHDSPKQVSGARNLLAKKLKKIKLKKIK